MEVYKARDFINSNEEVFNNLPKSFQLEFEDNVTLPVTKNKLIYSNEFWLFHRTYNKLPILSRHYVDHVLKGKFLTKDTHTKLLTIIGRDVRDVYDYELPEDINKIALLDQIITNNIFNKITFLSSAYVTTIHILDFIEINNYPPIKELVDNTQPNKESIARTYSEVKNILLTDPNIANNNLINSVRTGMVNIGQVLQCVSIRGFLTELDGKILPNPVMTNYTEGLNTLHDILAESRSGAKALFFNDTKIKDTEFFARRLQLLCMSIEEIDYNDCGTTEYLHKRITAPYVDKEAGVNYPGDLNFMQGKMYLDEETNTLKEITGDDPSLYNKVLKIRSVLYCKAPNKHRICKTCFGKLSLNVNAGAILGHLAPATTTKQSTSAVLSTKHLNTSSIGQSIELDEIGKRILKLGKTDNLFTLQPYLKTKSLKIVFNREETNGLSDVFTFSSLDNVNPNKISSITNIGVIYTDKGSEISLSIDIGSMNNKPIMTLDFLKYIKQHGLVTDTKGNFIFDMDEWNFSLPILRLPEMEHNFSDHSNQMAQIIESSMANISERSKPDSPDSTLEDLFILVNSKLKVNMVCLEVIIYASMVNDIGEQGLNRGSPVRALGVSRNIIAGRSLSNGLAYQEQDTLIINSESFIKGNRPDSVLDVNIDPKNVLIALEKRKRNR